MSGHLDHNLDDESDILIELNDAISQIAATWGLCERWDDDEADQRLNDATHATFNLLVGRDGV